MTTTEVLEFIRKTRLSQIREELEKLEAESPEYYKIVAGFFQSAAARPLN